ncbi:MAG: ribosomal protein S2p, partial [Segetibacter sp.]|nr:ribosomal protein S2p [Segetibacter sp.]
NDDATKSVAIITNYIAAAIAEGLAERQASKDDETDGDVDNDAEKRAARLQAEAEAEAARGGGKVRGGQAPKRRVPGGASRRPNGPGGPR